MMTETDRQLIEIANDTSRWHWRDIDALIAKADTEEARKRLGYIQCELYELVEETI